MNKQTKIILFSLTYVLGIISFLFDLIIPASLIIAGLFLFLYFKNKSISAVFLCILLGSFVFGLFNSLLNFRFDDNLTAYSDEFISAKVKVLSIPANSSSISTKFYAQVFEIGLNNEFEDNINSKTLVTIYDKEEKIKTIQIGDILSIKGKLKVPENAKNPSEFDYAKYLQYKDVFSLIYVNEDWQITGCSDDILYRLLRKLNKVRSNILEVHAKNIKSPMIEILGGIIFGDDAVNPDEDTKKSFMNSGIFHILAASGMNVTLIFGIWFFFAKNLKLDYKLSILTGIGLISVYTCMTGFGPPIIRAFLMLALILIGKYIDRTTPTMALLFLVGFLMLAFNPFMLLDVGFQLSFIVTFALIFTAPLIAFKFKHKFINYILGAGMIPIIAQLYAAPLQMYYFNTFALYSVFSNIAIIPVLSIVSFLGFISSILALIPAIADKICFIADLILNPLLIYIVKVAEFFSSMPFSIIYLKKPSIFQILLYFAIIIFTTCILKFKLYSKKVYISAGVLILLFLLLIIPIKSKSPEVVFFSVGNADSILIKSQDNDYFLIDTGKMPYLSGLSQADNIILKYFRDNDIKKLKGLILSHFDSDHAGGTINILEKLEVEEIFIPDSCEDTKLSDRIIKFINEKNISYQVVKKNSLIWDKNNFSISIYKPSGENIKTENQKSLIVKCNYKDKNMLFMGDGDINTFNSLPEDIKDHISLIKTGHHGAKNTINQEMINKTDIFVISTGKNIYNHPDSDTLKLLESNNKEYYRTDFHIAIKVIFSDKATNVFLYSPKNKKFIKTLYQF
ncbi:MAG: DNA internalization-related competence protein ComEC/Rec2 [Candidatus Gastranaerophilales bacterium]|nr:DNA internalization-related competence protein ComEC/Rec2 [Candidatus Gastranaerophilales bacterium]